MAPGRLLIAFSGGPDSLGLAALLRGGNPLLAYVDHGLRGRRASRSERALVRRLAGNLGLELVRTRVACASAAEEEARRARYEALHAVARLRGCSALAVAQSADDRAETLLLNLLRGTGLRGLASTRERLEIGGLLRLRPALGLRRGELRAIGAPFGPAADDPSNRSTGHLRTHVRFELMPRLAARLGADPVPALLALADAAAAAREALEERAREAAGDAGRARLLGEPPAAFPYLVEALRALSGFPGPPLTRNAYRALRGFLRAGRAGARHATPAGDVWTIGEGDRFGIGRDEATSGRPSSSSRSARASSPAPPPLRRAAPS